MMDSYLVTTPVVTSDGMGGRVETVGSVSEIYGDVEVFDSTINMRVRSDVRLPIGSFVLIPYDDYQERL